MDINTVAIIGRGALGLLYGDAIARGAGPDAITYVMDDERYGRHAAEPVFINGEQRSFPVERASEATPVDLVLFAVKASGLDDAIEMAAPLIGPHTRLLSIMNGITSEERIAERYGWENLPLCVAQGMDAVRVGNELTYGHVGQLRFGAAPGTDPEAVADIAAFLDRVGIEHVVEEDARRRLWAKWMLNVGINQTCMVYDSTYGEVSTNEEQFMVFVAAMREVLVVARAEGIDLTEADLTGMAELCASLDADGTPSMEQDRRAKRPSEVEEFAGELIRRAERLGILVPTNRFLYRRVKEIEALY